MKIARLVITDDGGKLTNDFMSEGFSSYELIGILTVLINTIIKETKGQSDGHQS